MTLRPTWALWTALALFAAATATVAQPTPGKVPVPPRPAPDQAGDSFTQIRQAVRVMDQDLSRVLGGASDPRDTRRHSAGKTPRIQEAHRAYLDQRTTVLTLVREAERPTSSRGVTQDQIDTAWEELERRYRRVLASAK